MNVPVQIVELFIGILSGVGALFYLLIDSTLGFVLRSSL